MIIEPVSTLSKPAIKFTKVDFPQPDGPTRTNSSADMTFKSKSSSISSLLYISPKPLEIFLISNLISFIIFELI